MIGWQSCRYYYRHNCHGARLPLSLVYHKANDITSLELHILRNIIILAPQYLFWLSTGCHNFGLSFEDSINPLKAITRQLVTFSIKY